MNTIEFKNVAGRFNNGLYRSPQSIQIIQDFENTDSQALPLDIWSSQAQEWALESVFLRSCP